jgi:hypothetical protein
MSQKQLSFIVQNNKATRGIRFVNYIIDSIIFHVLILFLGFFLGMLYSIGIEAPLRLISYLEVNYASKYLFISVLYFIYIFSIEYLTKGRSIGKFITKTKVVSIDGTTPTQKDFFIRNISRIVPFNALSFLVKEDGWHDLWSDTRVVNWEKYNADNILNKELDELSKNPNFK